MATGSKALKTKLKLFIPDTVTVQIEDRSYETFKKTDNADFMNLRSLFSTAHHHELCIRG